MDGQGAWRNGGARAMIHFLFPCLPELSGRQEVVGPLLDVSDPDIESGRDYTAFVEASGQVHHDLATAMIVHDLELADVTVLHHDGQESNHHLGIGSEEHLTLASLFGIVNGF